MALMRDMRLIGPAGDQRDDRPLARGQGPHIGAAGILIALFLVQSRGTAGLGKYFGPITAVCRER